MELWAVMDWRFEIPCRGQFSHIMYPDNDSDLKRSRCSIGLDRSGFDDSWGTQLASVSAHSLFGGRVKLRKSEMSFDCCVVNVISRDLKPLR